MANTDQNKLVAGSLAETARRNNTSLSASFMSVRCFVMVDVSGSMRMVDCEGGRSRFDVATEQLVRLQNENAGDIAVGCFSDRAELCPSGVPVMMGGETHLDEGLRLLKMADGTDIRLVLISDGAPHSEESAMAVARSFQSPISTIYVGREGGAGCDFLRCLAAATGGVSIVNDTKKLNLLSENITRLLAA